MHMRPKIKICGIKNRGEIDIVNKYPVDYIGFIFAPSQRQVTMEQAMDLRSYVRDGIQVVGVFVNEDPKVVNEIAIKTRLDVIQLHGDEDDAYCRKIQRPCWKSISIIDKESLCVRKMYKHTQGLLLDTYHPRERGGTGETFSWSLVEGLSTETFLILAGGLTPDNIHLAMDQVQPHVLDVNSGVETHYMKDENKIKALFHRLDLKSEST